MELGFSASSGAAGTSSDTVRRQIPPQVIALTFFGIDVSMYGFLANPKRSTLVDHAVTDLLGRPTVLDALDHAFTQLRMFDQLALSSTTFRLHQVGSSTVIAIASRHALVREMVAL